MTKVLTLSDGGGFSVVLQDGQYLPISPLDASLLPGGSPLTPQPHALEATQIVDPQNVTTVATPTGATVATVHGIDGTAYTGRVWSTFRDLVAAWGTLSPVFGAPVNIVFASSHIDASDPVAGFTPIVEGFLNFIGAAPPAPVVVSLTGVVGKDRAAGANSALLASGPTAAGQYLVNATHPSAGWAYRVTSGSVHMCGQPMVQTHPGGGITPAEVDTWGEGDSVTCYEPIAIYFASMGGTDASGAGTAAITLYNVTMFEPSGVPLTTACSLDTSAITIVLLESRVDCLLAVNGVPADQFGSLVLINSYVSSAMVQGDSSPGIILIGGVFLSFGAVLATVDGDAILGSGFGSPTLSLGVTRFGCAMGFVCLDTAIQLLGGSTIVANLFYGGGVAYASTTAGAGINFNVENNARLVYDPNATATNTFTFPLAIAPGIGMNGGTLASSEDGGSPTVIEGSIQTTVTNLDAPQGPGSFGGKAFLLGGGTIADFV